MKKIFQIALLFLSVNSFAQEPDFVITGTAYRAVEPAYRMSESPKIIDTTITAPVVEYPLLVLQFPTYIDVQPIDPATVKTEGKLAQLYHNYLKLGIGTEMMPLGEFYFDSKRSRKYLYGAHVKHLSSFGNFPNYAPATFDRTNLSTYGAINQDKYTLKGEAHYGNQGLHYYGWRIPTDSLPKDSLSQRFQDIGGAANFIYHKKDSAGVNFKTGFQYNYFTGQKPLNGDDKIWRPIENYIAFTTGAWYKLGKEIYAADFNVRYNGYNYGDRFDTNQVYLDSGIQIKNTVVNFKPSITTYLMNNRVKAKIGMDLVINGGEKTKAYIYPLIEAKYSLFNDIFIPYVGLKGGLKQVTYKSLVDINEFILPNLQMRNEHTAIEAYGGFKGTLSKRMSFNLSASFAKVKDKLFFITDTVYSPGNKFNIIFDTLNLTTIEGSLSYQLAEKIKIDGIGRYYSYDLKNNSYAWNLPQWQAILRGSYNLYDKFLVNLDLNFEGGRRALVYQIEEDVTIENLQLAKDLGLIADINLGIEYRYNKRISAFAQVNNVASQRYMRWYNFPVQPLQFMGGVTFRF